MRDPVTLDPVPVAARAAAIVRGTLRVLEAVGYAGLTEFPLASGRRADIAALGAAGEIVIVEVKSSLQDFRTDRKWAQYGEFCDRFYFAVSDEFPREVLPEGPGLIIADGFGGAVLREAPTHPLAPARRKAVTLRFARLAAARLLRAPPVPATMVSP
jgi:hypothetical protein